MEFDAVGRSDTLHAARRVGAMNNTGREALLEYIRRPAVVQERDARTRRTRAHRAQEGMLIRNGRCGHDPAVALASSRRTGATAEVLPLRDHEARPTVRYSGVLASVSKLRSRIAPGCSAGAGRHSQRRRGCCMRWGETDRARRIQANARARRFAVRRACPSADQTRWQHVTGDCRVGARRYSSIQEVPYIASCY